MVGVEEVSRAGLRVTLTPTSRHDLSALQRALARTHPELAAADAEVIQAFAARDDRIEQLPTTAR